MARKITVLATKAFLTNTPFKYSNTEVRISDSWAQLMLHGNPIAQLSIGGKLQISNCGWFSNTTKERLNALPGVSIYQKKGVWYLNGKEWDGTLISIKN